MLLEAFLVGGALYAGARTYQQMNRRGRLRRQQQGLGQPPRAAMAALFDATAPSLALQQANQNLALSSASLGLATASIVWVAPLLSVASLPPMLYVFIPTFQTAWQSIVQERRVNNPVLDAVRITVCVVMGYSFVAALNAFLQAITQRHFAQADIAFQERLRALFGGEFGTAQRTVWCYINGAEVQLPIAEIPLGAIVVVAAAEVVPVTGKIVYGTAWLDQRFSTGEAKPVRKGRGEQVSAGAIVQQGRLYLQVEELEQRLLSSTLRDLLEQSVDQPTPIRQAGEKSAEQMAPRMLLTFAFTLPFLGANHAAAFLTTGFGNHLRTLGPNTVRNFLIPAAEQGIVIKQARALEVANLVNVLIFDAQVLTDPVARTHAPQVIAALRQRPRLPNRTAPQRLAVYVFVPANAEALGRQLTTECGLDDYLAATTPAERAATIAGLQAGGRTVCYIGAGAQDAIVLEKAQVSIAWRGAATLATSRAQVVLLDRDLHQLLTFFDLAATFAIKQGFNLVVPIMLDLVDIGTTVFMGLNLGYSILFTYGGLWLGALYANLRPRPAAIQAAPVTPPPTPLLLPHI
jgi:cation transport ATPase